MKPKIGLASLISPWFAEIGAGGGFEAETAKIAAAFAPFFEVTDPGPIDSEEKALRAVKMFRTSGVDAVAFVHVAWSSDGPLVRIAEGMKGLPFLVWCYLPSAAMADGMTVMDVFKATGPVGTMQGSAPFRRMNVNFHFLFGTAETVQKKLEDFSAALGASASLKSLRIGLVGPRCECMTGTYVDEAQLLLKLGVKIIPISASQLFNMNVSGNKVSRFVTQLKKRYRTDGVSDEALRNSARVTLAVERAVTEHDLDGISIEDLNAELLELFHARPALWTDGLSRRGTAVTMEGDVVSLLGVWAASRLSGAPAMYSEVFCVDSARNLMLTGHATMHDLSLAGGEITLIPDREYENAEGVEGAWMHFVPKPGRVTLVNFFDNGGGYRAFSCLGEALKDNASHPLGYTSALVRPDIPVPDLFERTVKLGMTQHFAMCCGDVTERLRMFCSLSNVEYVN